jgi:thymidine phosphorylase
MAVLRGAPEAPSDLRERALDLAGALIDIAGFQKGGRSLARKTLDSGMALKKFIAICEAQGGLRTPPTAAHRHTIAATQPGRISALDNRSLSRVAKLAGAPQDAAAGLDLHVKVGAVVDRDTPLFTVHAETPGELEYALEFQARQAQLVTIDPA